MRRLQIGQTYCFGDVEGKDLVATVTAAIVSANEQEVIIGVTDVETHKSSLLRSPLSAHELAHTKNTTAYFGDKRVKKSKRLENVYDLFEWSSRLKRIFRATNSGVFAVALISLT